MPSATRMIQASRQSRPLAHRNKKTAAGIGMPAAARLDMRPGLRAALYEAGCCEDPAASRLVPCFLGDGPPVRSARADRRRESLAASQPGRGERNVDEAGCSPASDALFTTLHTRRGGEEGIQREVND